MKQVVQCTVCAWRCRIKPGEVGVCGTRRNQDGKLKSLVYGRTTGVNLDPVEKKPFYHFLPGTKFLSFGTIGCNFGCLFCQNAWMSQAGKRSGDQAINRLRLTTITPEEMVEMAMKVRAAGIAYTYNEPAIFVEYAHDTMVLARAKGLTNVWVSNGFESEETFNYIRDYLDAINIDLKSFREQFYREVCKAKIEPVKANIKRFFMAGIETEVTTLVIPGYNDTIKELTDIAEFLKAISPDIPWHVSAYYPAYKLKAPPTPHETLVRAYEIGKQAGLKYVYLGNAEDEERLSTRCPRCNTLLVKRWWHGAEVVGLAVDTGTCRKCGEKIYGKYS